MHHWLIVSSQNQVPIMNLHRTWIKAPYYLIIPTDVFTDLLCSDQKRSLKQLIPTVDYSLGSYVCQIGGSASCAKKLQTTEKQSRFCLPRQLHACRKKIATHVHGGIFKEHYLLTILIIKQFVYQGEMYTMCGPICSEDKLFIDNGLRISI